MQLIKSNARVSVTTTESGEQRTSNTLIDHFSSSHSKYIIEADVIKTGMVDHYLVYGIRKINAWRSFKSKKQRVIESRNMRKYNKAYARNDIQQVEWDTILSAYCDNTMDMATIFLEIFESILDIHAPLRVRSDVAPWLTPSLKRSILERDKLNVQAENSPEIWSAYKRKRSQVTKMIHISIRDYYNGLIEENIRDPRKMWRKINTVLEKNALGWSFSRCLKITPTFKSGAKNDVNSYKPISVISVFSRILERIVHEQLYEFLRANKVIIRNQFAFQKLYSKVPSLICSTDSWYKNVDHKKLN